VAAKAAIDTGNVSNVAEVEANMVNLKLSRTCDFCKKSEATCNAYDNKLRYCSQCLLTKYCSEQCRAAAEPAHKAACLVEVAAREERKGKGKA